MSKDDVRAAFDAAETLPPVDDMAGDPVDPAEGGEAPPVDIYEEDTPTRRCAGLPLNDYGNGLRLIQHFGEQILFVPRLGWYRWDGRRWAPDEDEIMVRSAAQKISGLIEGEIHFIALSDAQRDALALYEETRDELNKLRGMTKKQREQDASGTAVDRFIELIAIEKVGAEVKELLKSLRKSIRDYAKSSGNTNKIANMLTEAKTGLSTSVGALNADPLRVCCENGTIEFTSEIDELAASYGQKKEVWRATLLPHNRDHMISKMVTAAYDPRAKCETFDAFLAKVQPDPEVRAFLKRWFGYNLTGLTTEQKLLFNYGGGRNGKSTLVDLIARILADYGTTIPIESLTGSDQRKGSDATPDLVRLPGARMVRASEPEQGQKMKEALIKSLTGGEAIMIRRMQQEFVEVQPEFKLTISGNHKPEIRGGDDGIWRRVLLLNWGVQIANDEVDPLLPQKMWAERDGILRWLVEGFLEYARDGLNPPASILAATEEYRRDSDPTRVFLTEECEITGSSEDFETGGDLRDAMKAWLFETDHGVWGSRTISNHIKRRAGVIKGPDGQVYTDCKRSDTGYIGIKLLPGARQRMADRAEDVRQAERGRR